MAAHLQVRSMEKKLEKAGIGPNNLEDVEASRERLRNVVRIMRGPAKSLAEITDDLIEGPSEPIPVRIYRPKKGLKGGATPVVLFFHGGGWIIGGLDTSDESLQILCGLSGAVIISVDYRLAPEHKFPAGLEDCYAATVWAARNAEKLGGDTRKLVVAGASAGGNLAAATTLLAKKRKGPRIATQILIYPNVDMTKDMSKFSDSEFGPSLAELQWMVDLYLHDKGETRNPLVSPLLADLGGLPRALVFTAENDTLREQDEAYAKNLRKAGVRARIVNYPGAVHGFWNYPSHFDSGQDAVRKAASAIRSL